ncbi:hypothetical protein DFH09DRAFT_1164893 [Mycena vulgaris]|nr:hypothetical protein DFH09DRAFT_1164893 [Mycena vulgaris]
MSASARKDRVYLLGIHPAPSHLSKQEFDTKINSFIDSILSTPAAKRLLPRADLFFQKDGLDDSITTFRLPGSAAVVCIVRYEFESHDHLVELLHDHEFLDVFLGNDSEEIAFHTLATMYTSTPITKIAKAPLDLGTQDRKHLWIVFPNPGVQSDEKFDQSADLFAALPVVQANLVNHTLWVPSKEIDSPFHELGRRPADPTFIVTFEAETWEHLKTVVLDAEYKDLVLEAIKDLGMNQGFSVAADAVSKFNSV